LDMHPRPHRLALAFEPGSHWTAIGHVERAPSAIGEIRAAEAILASAINEGLFGLEERVDFTTLRYYDAIEDWEVYLKRPKTGPVQAPPRKLAHALGLLRERKSRIRLRQDLRASRLRPLQGATPGAA